MYRTLDPDRIVETITRLENRIAERFPGSGLRKVCAELLQVARESRARVTAAARPNYVLRAASFALTLAGLALLGYVAAVIEVKRDADNVFGVLQGIDSAFNIVVLMGAAAIFLAGLEARWKRQSALAGLHELRSIVHVIDMHQLTKDPSTTATICTGTPSSPLRELNPFELMRYLDYCAEMLSLSAKVGALYAQHTRDSVVLAAESDLAHITTHLSTKIWQKIEIVQSWFPGAPGERSGRSSWPAGAAE